MLVRCVSVVEKCAPPFAQPPLVTSVWFELVVPRKTRYLVIAAPPFDDGACQPRSEERRAGKECRSCGGPGTLADARGVAETTLLGAPVPALLSALTK